MFCKKCGANVDDDAMFCENCGTPVKRMEETGSEPLAAAEETVPENEVVQEAAPDPGIQTAAKPKKSFPKWLIPAVAVVVVVVIAAIVLLSSGGSGGGKDSFYNEMNYNNLAHFAYDDHCLYFVSEFDDNAEGTSVFSTDYKGVNKQMICDNDDIIRIRVIDGKIYYVESADDCYNIGVMDTDGEHGRTIVSMENSVSKFAVSGKRLYYVTDSNLYSCGLDGEDSVLLVENVKTFVLGSNAIYYVSDDVIKTYNMKKETSTDLCRASGATDLALDHNTLYFACDSGLSCVDVKSDGTVTKVINDSELSAYVFHGEYIYYIESFDSDELSAIASYLADDDTDLILYKLFFAGTGELYQANKDGSNAQKVENSDAGISYALYTYPDGLYCQMSALSSEIQEIEFE